MDVVGLAIGIVGLWESCVQVFEVVTFARQYDPIDQVGSRARAASFRVTPLAWMMALTAQIPDS
jgi:hypothetical protein